jgi:hypothetical protein
MGALFFESQSKMFYGCNGAEWSPLGSFRCEEHANYAEVSFEFGQYGNTDGLSDQTFTINLMHGRTATLTGWTSTRDYHDGFLNYANDDARAVVSDLVPGAMYEVQLFQFAAHADNRHNNPLTINGQGPYDARATADQSADAAPTWTGVVAADANGAIDVTFDRTEGHVVLTGISVIAIC